VRIARFLKLFASALAVLLLGSAYFTTAAVAQRFPEDEEACEEFLESAEEEDADTAGCLNQEGDNDAESDNDFEGTGGDGVAGSNVIGTAGSGDTDITASNDSRFADAEGGNVEAESNTTINNGPELSVEGGNTDVTAIATGISTVNQLATPEISITLNQVSTSTGTPVVSNTVTSLTTLTAVNSLGQSLVSPTAGAGGGVGTATGAGPVTQTLTQVGSSTVNNVFAPVVTTTATNTASVTGSAPVNQTGSASSAPTATATAGPNTTRAFLTQTGDNDVDADNDFEGVGGDGVAGSNIIGVAGSGDTSIDATNVSEFANGEGGDTEFQSDLVVDNGPDLTVSGGNTRVLADALGISTVDQVAAPVIGLTVTQTATAVGPQEISNSVSSATNITGANILSQAATGGSPVSPTGTGTGASPVSPTGTGAAPIVFIFSPTQSIVMGDGNTCTQNVGAVAGDSTDNDNFCFTNIFAPVFNFGGGVTPTAFSFGGAGGVTPTATGAGGGPLFGPVTQTLNQTGSSAVTNTFAPVINTIASNTANVTGSSPVTQIATAITNPTATAQAGPNTTRGALVHEGDNDFESDVDGSGVGGDGIAGSNVIGVAGSGDTTINATNNSLFADGEGGDTIFEQTTTADNGPTVSIEGGNVDVTAIATGIAEVNQTATPSVTISLDQVANATGPSTVSNTVSSSTTIIGSNVLTQSFTGGVSPTGTSGVTPTFGTVTQTLNQTGSSTVDNDFSPTINTTSTNSSTLSGSSPVNQTATTVSNPTAIAIAP